MVVVLAKLKIKPGSAVGFVRVARQLVAALSTEPGRMSYELTKEEGGNAYAILERYRDGLGRLLSDFLDGKPELITLTCVD
jgi:quinol monooxygenase YgiN